MPLEAHQYDPSKYFADIAETGDASVVVTGVHLARILVYCNDFGVHRGLWYSSFFPALAKDFVQWDQ